MALTLLVSFGRSTRGPPSEQTAPVANCTCDVRRSWTSFGYGLFVQLRRRQSADSHCHISRQILRRPIEACDGPVEAHKTQGKTQLPPGEMSCEARDERSAMARTRVSSKPGSLSLLQGLPILLSLSAIMFLLFTAVLHQPKGKGGEISRNHDSPTGVSGGLRYAVASVRATRSASPSTNHETKVESEIRVTCKKMSREASCADSDMAQVHEVQTRGKNEQHVQPPEPTSHTDLELLDIETSLRGAAEEEKVQTAVETVKNPDSALIFTMDSIDTYVQKSKKGGAAGEITIRRSLETGLAAIGFQVDVATSDGEFDRLSRSISNYAVIILDAWTWAAPGWKPKPVLQGHESRIFLLDFFGAPHPTHHGIDVPPQRILTAFDTTPWNTFLGYFIEESTLAAAPSTGKKMQGVIWGKDPKHYTGRAELLRSLADHVDLHSTLPSPVVRHERIKYHGHLRPEEWQALLRESRFMLGLGDPLLGPSAIDAIAAGCMYINPVYDKPVRDIYTSQHPHAEKFVGPPYVCSAKLEDVDAVKACADKAMSGSELPPLVPPELTKESYIERVKSIFGPFKDELR